MLQFTTCPKRETPAILTVWYKQLLAEFSNRKGFVARIDQASLVLPTFDLAMETNWPFYGIPGFLKGNSTIYRENAVELIQKLLDRVGDRKVLIFDMYQWSTIRQTFREERRLIFACGTATQASLRSGWDFSFPALPIIQGKIQKPIGERKIFASFRGRPTHPVRKTLATLHNGSDVIVQVISLAQADATYIRKVSPSTKTHAAEVKEFVDLAENSLFSFTPRGDCLFSYRLLEVMRAGSVPVILSDGWALPFEELIDWKRCSVVWPEKDAGRIIEYLKALSSSEIQEMRHWAGHYYSNYLADFERQTSATLQILEKRGIADRGTRS